MTEIGGIGERQGITADATCLGCACLCDDVAVAVEEGRIVGAERACARGVAWFETGNDPRPETDAASIQHAIERAADWLAGARSPVVVGLEWATIEAQRVALAIADEIGAAVASGGVDSTTGGWHEAFARVGAVGATLGEIRDRADLIVFDGRNPPASMPRFAERFVDPPGRFVPEGRRGRTVVWLGDAEPAAIERAIGLTPDVILPLRRPEGYSVARAVLRAAALPGGAEVDAVRGLAARLKAARYGVLVLGGPPGDGAAEVEEALKLVRDLNRTTRFVVIHPSASGENAPGAAAVMTWQAGAASDLDLALGRPRRLPGEGPAYRMSRGEVDVVLDLGGGDTVDRPEVANIHVGRDARSAGPSIAIRTGRPGIDEGGTVMRFDGVTLPLRPPLQASARRPTQIDVLQAILTRLGSRNGGA